MTELLPAMGYGDKQTSELARDDQRLGRGRRPDRDADRPAADRRHREAGHAGHVQARGDRRADARGHPPRARDHRRLAAARKEALSGSGIPPGDEERPQTDRRRARRECAPAQRRARHRGRAARQPRRHVHGARADPPAGPVVLTHGNGPQVGNELLRQELPRRRRRSCRSTSRSRRRRPRSARSSPPSCPQIAERPGRRAPHPRPRGRGRSRLHEPDQAGRAVLRRGSRREQLEKRPRLDAEGGRRPRLAPRRRLAEAARDPRAGEHQRAHRHRRSVVAVGGGGIPVVARENRHDGIDAVIDKDLASALLATGLGAAEAPHPHAGGRRLPRLRHRRAGADRRAPPRTATRRSSPSSPPARCAPRSRPRSRSCARPAARSRSRAPRRSRAADTGTRIVP